MKLWVAGLSLLAVITGCTACTCIGGMTPKDHYCNADFVLRARVLSTLVNPDENINTNDAFYPIRVLQTYKVPAGNTLGKSVFTAGNDAMCGIAGLEQGEYILSGSMFDGKMRLSLCSSLAVGVPLSTGSAYTQELMDVLANPPICGAPP